MCWIVSSWGVGGGIVVLSKVANSASTFALRANIETEFAVNVRCSTTKGYRVLVVCIHGRTRFFHLFLLHNQVLNLSCALSQVALPTPGNPEGLPWSPNNGLRVSKTYTFQRLLVL